MFMMKKPSNRLEQQIEHKNAWNIFRKNIFVRKKNYSDLIKSFLKAIRL